MLVPLLIITLIYFATISYFIWGFSKISLFTDENTKPKTKFSIIIPFRNEAENLPALVRSLKQLNYPESFYEIIFVDDDSSDNSATILSEAFKNETTTVTIIKNTRVSRSPKKDAISKAIKIASGKWIVTTDADCVLPELWLSTLSNFINNNDSVFIAGPVNYYDNDSFLKRFQALDFISLIGVTIGSFGSKLPILCNGANLAYKKELFININGFDGNDSIASGDDIFLLEKAAAQFPKQTHFLKSKKAIVLTKPVSNFKKLINQRVRWASKTANYNNWAGKLTGLIVLLMNALIISTLVMVIFKLLPFRIFIFLFSIKFGIDFLLLFKTSHFLNTKKLLRSYLVSSLIYPFFNVFVAFKSLFFSYKWKDRRFNK